MDADAWGEKASEAAEEMAGRENRFARIESDLTVVKWMLGVQVAGLASLVLKVFVWPSRQAIHQPPTDPGQDISFLIACISPFTSILPHRANGSGECC